VAASFEHTKNLQVLLRRRRTHWFGSKGLNSNSGGAGFESRSEHRLPSPSGECRDRDFEQATTTSLLSSLSFVSYIAVHTVAAGSTCCVPCSDRPLLWAGFERGPAIMRFVCSLSLSLSLLLGLPSAGRSRYARGSGLSTELRATRGGGALRT
jgi:hypothetical protein